jgi:hypothetical protein
MAIIQKLNIPYFTPVFLQPLRHLEHDVSLPMPKRPQQWALHGGGPTSTSPEDERGPSCSNVDRDFPELTVPHLLSQYELNDLVRERERRERERDLCLSKIQPEISASRLQGRNLLQPDVKG